MYDVFCKMTIVVQPPVSNVGQYWMGLFVVTLMETCHSGTGDDPLAISWPSCLDYAQVIWDKSKKKNFDKEIFIPGLSQSRPFIVFDG